MRADLPAVELLPRPEKGRVFTETRKVRLGDADCDGRLRLDATARFLQDVATDDASDADLDRRFGWLVRRTKIVTTVPAMLGETVEVATWCTGIGRSWAERRSSIFGERGASIDAVSLWVQIDVETGRPARIADDFARAYAATAAGRSVSARLALAPIDNESSARPWQVRRSDLDPFGHVNNAATWAFVEEYGGVAVGRVGTAELEYLLPIQHPDTVNQAGDGAGAIDEPDRRCEAVVANTKRGSDLWITVGGVVHAAARWTPGALTSVSEG